MEIMLGKKRVDLVRGLPLRKLTHKLQYYVRLGDASRRAVAFFLVEMHRRKQYQVLGYSSAVHYAVKALDLTKRQARELLRVGMRLEELPEIDRAFSHGEISWTKVREITRVARPENEEAWLEFARARSSEEVQWGVSHARAGRSPVGNGKGTPRAWCRILADVPAHVAVLFDTAVEKCLNEKGEGATHADAIKEIAESYLGQTQEGNGSGDARGKQSVYTVVIHMNRERTEAWMDGESGPVPISTEVAEEAAKTSTVIEANDIEDPGDARTILFGERGTVPPEERDDPVTEAMRRVALARDGHRCVVCGSRCELRAHHLHSRAYGGKTRLEHLVSLCGRCHTANRLKDVMCSPRRKSLFLKDLPLRDCA